MSELSGRYTDRETLDEIFTHLKTGKASIAGISHDAAVILAEQIMFLENENANFSKLGQAAARLTHLANEFSDTRLKMEEATEAVKAALTPADVDKQVRELRATVGDLRAKLAVADSTAASAKSRQAELVRTHEAAMQEADQRMATLIQASSSLISSIERMMNSDAWRAAFNTAAKHGVVYDGPNISHELDSLRGVLHKITAQGLPAKDGPAIKSL